MSMKRKQQHLRTAKRLVQEWQRGQRGQRAAGFLARLCRWERARPQDTMATLQHWHD